MQSLSNGAGPALAKQPSARDWCTSANCVDAVRTADGVLVTSTIEGNDGAVTFTQAEWDAFIPAVKAGAWDHTVSGVLVA